MTTLTSHNQEPVDPSTCDHWGSLLVTESTILGDSDYCGLISVCPRCGTFQIYGSKNGEKFTETFRLNNANQVKAAGQYAVFLSRSEVLLTNDQ